MVHFFFLKQLSKLVDHSSPLLFSLLLSQSHLPYARVSKDSASKNLQGIEVVDFIMLKCFPFFPPLLRLLQRLYLTCKELTWDFLGTQLAVS